MPRHWPVVAGVLLSLSWLSVMAQSPSPTADEEAMARARRQAENPMRRILEAGRITVRRRPVNDAPEAGTPVPTEPASEAGRSLPAGAAPGPVAAEPPLPAPGIRVTVEPIQPASANQPAPMGAQFPPPAAAVPSGTPAALPLPPAVRVPGALSSAVRVESPDRDASLRLPVGPVAMPASAPVFKTMEWAPDAPPEGPRTTTALPAPAAPTEEAAAPPEPVARTRSAVPSGATAALPGLPAAPTLRTVVEPALTDRLRHELGRVDAVTVDLALNADGSVQDAVFLTRVPAGVRRALYTALLQWRYDAMPGPTTHRVEMAFEP